mmetsp:Transcript_4068/g.10821  ORF Transcript_4068/g.10821 Transcript_4068/m.10821 type:complete len:319 (-) Transcript_4068:41-997(-)
MDRSPGPGSLNVEGPLHSSTYSSSEPTSDSPNESTEARSPDLQSDTDLFTESGRGQMDPKNKCWVKSLVCLVLFILVLAVSMLVRHFSRGSELEPLVIAIESSHICYHAATRTCALDFNAPQVAEFDLHPAEHPLFGFLFAQLLQKDKEQMRKILKGAHISVNDTARDEDSIYRFLTTLPGAHKRISSHRSDRAQYGIPEGHVVSTLLVGHLNQDTWFQLEGAPWSPGSNPGGSLLHILDFLEYGLTHHNVGPLGTSDNTDKHPLKFNSIVPAAEACPKDCNAPSATVLLQRALRQKGRHSFLKGVMLVRDAGTVRSD